MVIGMLKNCNCKYYNHNIIKFVGFMPIYYAINLDIVLSCMVFSCLYLGLSNYYKFKSIILFFLSKKKKKRKSRLGKLLTKNAAFAMFVQLAKE